MPTMDQIRSRKAVEASERYRILPGTWLWRQRGRAGEIQTRADLVRSGREPEYLERIGLIQRISGAAISIKFPVPTFQAFKFPVLLQVPDPAPEPIAPDPAPAQDVLRAPDSAATERPPSPVGAADSGAPEPDSKPAPAPPNTEKRRPGRSRKRRR